MSTKAKKSTILQARLSRRDKSAIVKAAKLRRMSLTSYLREVVVPMAEHEVAAAGQGVIEMTQNEQLALWKALHAPVKLTPAQKELGRLMRGEV